MRLKIGELAARTKLTVRTLHHYDAIGLLMPSARSEAGYRLYDDGDVARLHAILALRQFGLPLDDIAKTLSGKGLAMADIVAQQIQSIDQHMAQSAALRERLTLLQMQLRKGEPPDTDAWLFTLARMNTFHKYFSAAELQRIFERQQQSAPVWKVLFADAQAAMDQGLPADSPQVQALARRWIMQMVDWMDGDFELMGRWGEIYANEPGIYTAQCPSPAMVKYIGIATELRKEAFLRHMSLDELMQIRGLTDDEWAQLAKAVDRLKQQGSSLTSPAAKRVVKNCCALVLKSPNGNHELLAKVLTAVRTEPLLAVTSDAHKTVRDFISAALVAQAHPFANTPTNT